MTLSSGGAKKGSPSSRKDDTNPFKEPHEKKASTSKKGSHDGVKRVQTGFNSFEGRGRNKNSRKSKIGEMWRL